MLEPLDKKGEGIILEFKVHDAEDKADRIHKYGFSFEGKKVLIEKN